MQQNHVVFTTIVWLIIACFEILLPIILKQTMIRTLKIFRSYYFSTNKKVYARIATMFGVKAFHVYKLARGYKATSAQDNKILEELFYEGIINEIKS